MKRILNTALILTLALSFSCKAFAVVLDSQVLKTKIKSEVEKQIKSNTNLNGNIKVEVLNLPYERIETPNQKNEKVEIQAKINDKFFNPITLVRVNVLVNGETYRSFISQAKVSIYNNVWVANDYIKRGEPVVNIAYEEKEVSTYAKSITDPNFNFSKYVSEKNYNPGDIIDFNYLETIPAIIRNNPVSVIFKTGSVAITIPAIALDNGQIGDYIKIRSKDYKRDYQGKVIGENLVEVNI